MKKLVLATAVATGLVVITAGKSFATDLMSCDMEQAIVAAEALISRLEGTNLTDVKGVSIEEYVKYLQKKLDIAREAVRTGYAKYPEELYATVTEGTRALELITGIAKEQAKQAVKPTATQVQPKAQTQVVKAQPETQGQAKTQAVRAVKTTVETAKKVETQEKAETAGASQLQLKVRVQKPEAKLAVAKVESGMTVARARLTNLELKKEVAEPKETAGIDGEMKVPATGEVETGELEKILMTIGVASAVGMLVLAGICMLIGRRYNA